MPLNILLVETRPEAAEPLVHLMAIWGHAVRHARTPAEALGAAEAERFDVVLCDLHGRDGGAADLMVAVRRRSPRAVGVGVVDEGTDEQGLDERTRGAFPDRLARPVALSRLHAILDRAERVS